MVFPWRTRLGRDTISFPRWAYRGCTMAKGIRMLKGKEPLLRQIIFELRYRRGFTYLDKCGRILNRITDDLPEWVLGNEANPQGTALYSLKNRCRFSFSSTKFDLALDYTTAESPIPDEDVSAFVGYIAYFSRLLIDELAVNEFSRIGVRTLHYFSCDSRKDSEQWLRDLNAF